MDFQYILTHVERRIAYLTLNRPEVLNSFNEQMHQEVAFILDHWQQSEQIKVIVITGMGKGFCAGQDLSARKPEMIEHPDYDAGASLEKYYNPLILKIAQMPKVVIAAVNGVAAGAGANIALACDVVVAKQSASFIQSFSKVGLIPDAGGTWILPRLVGHARAKALTFLGNKLPADKALQWGMIWEVYPDDEFQNQVNALAETLALQPSSSVRLIKKALNLSGQNSLEQQLNLERDLQKEAGKSTNYREGVQAFMQKRSANFD
ncbi:2-(1,2-epoxy-1,2-dihydrophenyl)acetyl-CoA isomerase [Acinetobacter sp. S40]|uniref:2-(1,2-epoxy-1,2-dihydrophenyl)acetyl-CoA isomerase PaaG n=1 Tax=unclassified Acinetobacter TaxID=196816 RepID=UPI00190CC8C7|nr:MULTISPECIES: 2-(1,2-epoxy-1,2-dihydrophenyl)acetyl-CoA isomerase PaaG [unclassified Acinetobacter]MBJ9986642.1 2-(1,2-epoxy-1,2-dihydrophenyl)acetyl-CoA isomerase [Acinetobacter sp. S40]MBK0063240.1 2-(1,2-epoxy-1,2-dihydrophenyl)acetyl-CoA isomerase [Acinetobacter sp. S55]MBK0066848.1 2-(1,2-epoxy-1,2-dihydrophenyl)acetyl-CoA isomerase [Acinetobacter sp. S54]